MRHISSVKPEYWVGKVDEEIISDARKAGLSEEGIRAMLRGMGAADRRIYKRELDLLSARNPGSVWACTTGYTLWFNSASQGERERDYAKLTSQLDAIGQSGDTRP